MVKILKVPKLMSYWKPGIDKEKYCRSNSLGISNNSEKNEQEYRMGYFECRGDHEATARWRADGSQGDINHSLILFNEIGHDSANCCTPRYNPRWNPVYRCTCRGG